MRDFLIPIVGLLIISCSTSTERTNLNDFQRYLATLKDIQIPSSSVLSVRSDPYDSALWDKFKYGSGSSWPCGKIFYGDSTVMIVEIGVGDFLWPLLTTFDLNGNVLDKLRPYTKSGVDMGYESIEHLSINELGDIIVIDSTTIWDINAEGDDIVEGTDKMTTDTLIYKVDKQGKFKRLCE